VILQACEPLRQTEFYFVAVVLTFRKFKGAAYGAAFSVSPVSKALNKAVGDLVLANTFDVFGLDCGVSVVGDECGVIVVIAIFHFRIRL